MNSGENPGSVGSPPPSFTHVCPLDKQVLRSSKHVKPKQQGHLQTVGFVGTDRGGAEEKGTLLSTADLTSISLPSPDIPRDTGGSS